MEVRKNIQTGITLKDEGNREFKLGNIQEALRKYHQALLYLSGITNDIPSLLPTGTQKDLSESDHICASEALLSCHLNMSMCYLKHEKYDKCVASSGKAIDLIMKQKNLEKFNTQLAKAYYRRALAYKHLKEYEKAHNDSLEAKKLAPLDGHILSLLTELNRIDKDYEKKSRQDFTGIFNK